MECVRKYGGAERIFPPIGPIHIFFPTSLQRLFRRSTNWPNASEEIKIVIWFLLICRGIFFHLMIFVFI